MIFDDFLDSPELYRELAEQSEFKSFHFELEKCTFHGISLMPIDGVLPTKIKEVFSRSVPTLSFLRKSPEGQREPHFIHTDIDMGDWSSILYLNPNPPENDGTCFWTHEETRGIESFIPHERSKEGETDKGWELRRLVKSKFNRLVVFPSSFFHSRSIFDNWSSESGSRLTQVTFGTGDIF